jgi:hypothetical protein
LAILAKPNDTNGAVLDSKIAALTTAAAATTSPQAVANLTAAAAAAQLETVQHYLGTGRILPSAIINTFSLSGAKLPNDATNANLGARITALTASAAIAGPQQSCNQQMLLQAQTELVQEALARGLVLPSAILSSLS